MESCAIPGMGFEYTATPVGSIMCMDNTAAASLFDASGSTRGFADLLEQCVQNIVMALRSDTRGENMLYGHWLFGSTLEEVHGFMPLPSINPDDYKGCYGRYKGMRGTALYDGEVKVLRAMRDFAGRGGKKKLIFNGFFYTLTDGCDYDSAMTEDVVAEEMGEGVRLEQIDSLYSILIGVNRDPSIQAKLMAHAQKVGYTEYIPIENATLDALKKLGLHVSQSLSSQSQKVGQGVRSQPVQTPGLTSYTF
jgi:hypothetical protein